MPGLRMVLPFVHVLIRKKSGTIFLCVDYPESMPEEKSGDILPNLPHV